MKFEEVIDGLMDGKYAQRKEWEATGEYVVLMPGMNNIWKILVQPVPNAGNYLPTFSDYTADDWSLLSKLEVAPPKTNTEMASV